MTIPILGKLLPGAPRKPCPAAPDIERRFARLARLVAMLIEKDKSMSREVEDLVAEVADIKTVIDAVVADHQELIEKFNAAVAASDLSAVGPAVADLRAQADRLRSLVASSQAVPAA
jgi:type I site-specific restriction endonuclease